MSAKYILDTDILSEYLKGHHAVVVANAARYAMRKVKAWLDQNEALTPVAGDYILAATIRATARKQGSLVELPDSLIAAVAVRLGRPLVTGNTSDFLAIQQTGVDLMIGNWREERL